MLTIYVWSSNLNYNSDVFGRQKNNHTSFLARLIWPFTKGVLFKHNECAGCGWRNFSLANLIFNKVGRVLKLHFFSSQWVVMSGQSQASQCVAATTPIPNDGHDLLLNSRGHRYFCTSNSNVGAPVNDTFRSTLEKRYRFRSTILFTGSSRILILARTSQLQSAVLAFTNILLIDVRLGLFGVQ